MKCIYTCTCNHTVDCIKLIGTIYKFKFINLLKPHPTSMVLVVLHKDTITLAAIFWTHFSCFIVISGTLTRIPLA